MARKNDFHEDGIETWDMVTIAKRGRDETPDLGQTLLRIVVKKRIRDNGGWREIAAEFGFGWDFWGINQHQGRKNEGKSTKKKQEIREESPIETGPARADYLPLGVVFFNKQERA